MAGSSFFPLLDVVADGAPEHDVWLSHGGALTEPRPAWSEVRRWIGPAHGWRCHRMHGTPRVCSTTHRRQIRLIQPQLTMEPMVAKQAMPQEKVDAVERQFDIWKFS